MGMKWVTISCSVFLVVGFAALAVFGVGCFYGTMFPTKYSAEISAACEKYGVERAVVFSVVNVESHFRADVQSPKGAIGLMQVMPSTAKMLAAQGEEIDLFDPQQNINFGVQYLSRLIARFENLQTALCAYNAGPTTVQKWLADENCSTDGKTLQNIPYAETKNYFSRFEKSYRYYKIKV